MPKKLTETDIRTRCNAVGVYPNQIIRDGGIWKLDIDCSECRTSFLPSFKNVEQNSVRRCKPCADKASGKFRRLSKKAAKKKCSDNGFKYVDHVNSNDVTVTCPICSNPFSTRAADLNRISSCLRCSYKLRGESKRAPISKIKTDCESVGHKFIKTWHVPVKGGSQRWVTVICPKCKKEIDIRFRHLMDGHSCYDCSLEDNTYFDRNKPAILYYVRFSLGSDVVYKIGITNRTVSERFRYDCYPMVTLLEEKFDIGKDAEIKETAILRRFDSFRRDFGFLRYGNTECFTEDVLKLDRH